MMNFLRVLIFLASSMQCSSCFWAFLKSSGLIIPVSTAFEAIFRSVYVMVDVWWHAKFMVVAIQQFVGSRAPGAFLTSLGI